jgi:hypothetical protein
MGYHADFVTGQYILPGDKVVAFLLEKSSSAGYPGSAACFPSYEYKVASVPLFGRFQEYGGFKADRNSAGAHYTLACHRLCSERQREAKEGGMPLPRTLGQLVKASPPLAFMLPETFQMMVSLALNQKAYDPLPVALEVNRKLHALLATPKGQAFLELKAELEDVEEAYLSASIRQEKATASELLMRLDSAKEAFGVSEYVNFNDAADAALRLSGSMMQTDPFTGERFELPAPLFIFSDYSGRCTSEVIGFAYEDTSEKEPILEGLLQAQMVDFALMLLGRLWQPSLYMGDERYNDTVAMLGAQLCAAALPAVQSDAQGLGGYIATKGGIVTEYADGELKRLRALLPKLKEVAAGLQGTIETLEKLG